MHSPVYILVLVSGIAGFWLFWDQAVKRILLDAFRERVFAQRFALFQLAMNGQLTFDSEVYRQIETLLCGLLRFAHNVTFLTFMFSRDQQEKARMKDGYVDVSREIAEKIMQLNPDVQHELGIILSEVRRSILVYVSFTSLLFLVVSAVLTVARIFGLWRPDKAREISDVVEREAYRAELKRTGTLAPA